MAVRDQSSKARKAKPMLRREKASPAEDFWHTLAVGLPAAVLLFLLLPMILT